MSQHHGASIMETMGIVMALVLCYTHADEIAALKKTDRLEAELVHSLEIRIDAAELAALQAMDAANVALEDAEAAHMRLEYLREQVVFAFSSIDSRRTRLPRPYPDPPRPTEVMAPVCYAAEVPDVAP